MRALVFAPLHNTPGVNKRTGRPWADAREFLSEGRAFCEFIGERPEVVLFDNRRDMMERREALLGRVHGMEAGSLDVLALCCHGWADGVQLGFSTAHARGLARELKEVATARLVVVLYCCSTGADDDGSDSDERLPGPGGDGGFADRLRDELGDAGVQATVFAHSVAGHCTRNPLVRVFDPSGRNGGRWLVEPPGKDAHGRKMAPSSTWLAWQRRLHSTDLRFRFPFLTQEQLESELA